MTDGESALAELVAEYGRVQAEAGRLQAEIMHRFRMLSALMDPGAIADPAPPLAPLAREAPREDTREASRAPRGAPFGTKRSPLPRLATQALRDAGAPLASKDLCTRVIALGYPGGLDSAQQRLSSLVADGTLVKVRHGVYGLPVNGHERPVSSVEGIANGV